MNRRLPTMEIDGETRELEEKNRRLQEENIKLKQFITNNFGTATLEEILNDDHVEAEPETAVDNDVLLCSHGDRFSTYNKRPGTKDCGKEFEYMMCAFYALRMITNANIVDYEMTTNNEAYGAFDDISLKITFKDNTTKTFLLQLKHKEKKEKIIIETHLKSPNNSFGLLKYLSSFETLDICDDVTCVVYTNCAIKLRDDATFDISVEKFEEDKEIPKKKTKKRKTSEHDNSGINVKVKERKCKSINFFNILSNHKKCESCEILQFEMSKRNLPESSFRKIQKFSEHFYLMTNQDSVEAVKSSVQMMLQKLLKCEINDSFVHFMKQWSSGRFRLRKSDVIMKLVELTLSPWIKTIYAEHDVKSSREKELVVSKYLLSPINPSMVLWYLDKIPITVTVDRINHVQIERAIHLLEQIEKKKKVLLMGDIKERSGRRWSIFGRLKDMRKLYRSSRAVASNSV